MKRKPIDISDLRHLYPFTSHYQNLNGLQYHYIDEGQGDAVVMVHGNPTWSFYFRELIKGLRDGYRCIVPDHIGCGLSDKPAPARYAYKLRDRVDDLENLLDSLKIDKGITLVLHDWGGAIGFRVNGLAQTFAHGCRRSRFPQRRFQPSRSRARRCGSNG